MAEKEQQEAEKPAGKNEELPEATLQVLSIYLEKYQPATECNATYRPTTAELKELIQEHTGEVISISELFSFLSENGFTYQPLQGAIVWLMADKT